MRMLGKPEWFTYRIGGWGIAPRTWQGWGYVAGFAALAGGTSSLPISQPAKSILTGAVVAILLLDCLVIWIQLGRHHDERQRMHQLIIERNCSLAGVLAVVAAMGWQTLHNPTASARSIPFDPTLLAILGAMVLTKAISTLWLRWRM